MIQQFVDRFMARKDDLRALFAKHPESYGPIVKNVISIISDGDGNWGNPQPDPDRITEIDHGNYQGTLLYVIGAKGYQPSTYWSVFVDYGSCSGCDTLEAIRNYDNDAPTEKQVDDYMTLALHIVQGMKRMNQPE